MPMRRATILDLLQNTYILSEIIEHLPTPTLLALSLSSEYLHSQASFKLYRTLRITRRRFISLIHAGQVPLKRIHKWSTFSRFLAPSLGRVTTLHLTDCYKLAWLIPKIPHGVFSNLFHVVLGRHPDSHSGDAIFLPSKLLDHLSESIRSVTILIYSGWQIRCAPSNPSDWAALLRRGIEVTVVLIPNEPHPFTWVNVPFTPWKGVVEGNGNIVRMIGVRNGSDNHSPGSGSGASPRGLLPYTAFAEWLEEPLAGRVFTPDELDKYVAGEKARNEGLV